MIYRNEKETNKEEDEKLQQIIENGEKEKEKEKENNDKETNKKNQE